MEDGLFPHQRSLQDAGGLEEERRLCYVGATRAMRELFLCYAEQRRLHGSDSFALPSRFINEFPREHVEEIRPRIEVTRPRAGPAASRKSGLVQEEAGNLSLGQRVRHGKFGEGVVTGCEGHGQHARVHVNFEAVGPKILMLTYAKLEVM